jgi:hypothetical protein
VASHSSGPRLRGRDDRPGAIALEEEIVEVATLGRVKDVDREIIQDEEINDDEFAQLRVIAVVEARVFWCFQHLVGADGEDAG